MTAMKELEPLGLTPKQVLAKIPNKRILQRAIAAGWLKPHIAGKNGRCSLYDFEDVKRLWKRLGMELPPRLKYEKQISCASS